MHPFTKEYDGDVGLVYMYQRWYCPETGTFMSKAPMPRWAEESYGFAALVPTTAVDPTGRKDRRLSRFEDQLLWDDSGPPPLPPPGPASCGIASALGKVWAFPYTAIGVGIGVAGVPIGILVGPPPGISFEHNAVQFTNHPFATSAFTLGNSIIYPTDMGPDTPSSRYDDAPCEPGTTVGDHEEAHTLQYERLGPTFAPFYFFIGGGISRNNPLEVGADDHADRRARRRRLAL